MSYMKVNCPSPFCDAVRECIISSVGVTGPTGPMSTGPTGPGFTGVTGPTGPMSTGPTGPMSTGPTGPSGGIVTSYYGSFISTTTQTVLGVGTATPITHDSTLISNGVVLGIPTSRVYIQNSGVYKLSYSIQFEKNGANSEQADIWLSINGSPVNNSAGVVVISGNDGKTFPFCEYIVNFTAGQYFEFVFTATSSSMKVAYIPAAGSVPAVPSIITNVYRIG
jgi:hypothetical protein